MSGSAKTLLGCCAQVGRGAFRGKAHPGACSRVPVAPIAPGAGRGLGLRSGRRHSYLSHKFSAEKPDDLSGLMTLIVPG